MFEPKRHIADTLRIMMNEIGFDHVTVSGLIERSRISRSTFYRYFSDKFDVMHYYYRQEVDQLLVADNLNWQSTLIDIFSFIQYRRDFFDHVIQRTETNSFIAFLYDYSFTFYEKHYCAFYGMSSLDKTSRYLVEFACAGSVELVKKWAQRKYIESAEEMASLTFQLLPMRLRCIFEE